MKKIIIMGIPHHGNIGDNAIAVAEEKMVNKFFSEYELYTMQEKYLDICSKKVKKIIKDEDILLLHGGGNIGDTYARPEKGRREIIKNYPNNKIIIFPQTSYFSDSAEGKNELKISKEIYNKHRNLIIMAREEKSYKFMKENFYNAKIYYTPDIVMSLKETGTEKREGALLLFRTDKERKINDNDIEKIKKIMKKMFKSYTVSDMNIGSGIVNIGGQLREKILNEKFKQFRKSEIVITDRLHGMIFAAITETPCIVLENFNHKISESYKWLKKLKYIKFCDDISKIDRSINEAIKIEDRFYDNTFAEETISEILKSEI